MEAIRDQQESLARLHFELSAKQDIPAAMSDDGEISESIFNQDKNYQVQTIWQSDFIVFS